ncbi:MAG: hypothetical protein ACMUHX_04615 [bacterium]
MLETFISPRMFGGMGEGLGIIEQYLNVLAVDKLVYYSCQYGKISVAKRIGWALERAGVGERDLKPLLDLAATGYHVLDPARPHHGPCNQRWMIQNNLGEKGYR